MPNYYDPFIDPYLRPAEKFTHRQIAVEKSIDDTNKLFRESFDIYVEEKKRELYHKIIPVPSTMESLIKSLYLDEHKEPQQIETTIPQLTPSQIKLMTKLHYQIYSALLPVCLTTTDNMRKKYYPDKDSKVLDEDDKRKQEIAKMLNMYINSTEMTTGLAASSIRSFAKMIAIATDNKYITIPNITDNSLPAFDPLTVVVLEENKSSHGYQIGKPYIVTHGMKRLMLDDIGRDHHSAYGESDKSHLATPEEIESCLETLTPAQCRTILSNELFAPMLEALFSTEEVEEEKIDKNNIVSEKQQETNEHPPQ